LSIKNQKQGSLSALWQRNRGEREMKVIIEIPDDTKLFSAYYEQEDGTDVSWLWNKQKLQSMIVKEPESCEFTANELEEARCTLLSFTRENCDADCHICKAVFIATELIEKEQEKREFQD